MNKVPCHCPLCDKLLCKVSMMYSGSVFVWCRHCKKEVEVKPQWETAEGRAARPQMALS